jgi:hypothetical protein
VASPELCRAAVADPDRFAADHDLTALELKRLLHSARQPGMKVCWSLHRANRLGPIHAVLPLTCRALGGYLRRELDAFWNGTLPEDVQFKSEAGRFAAFLRGRTRDGHLDLPVVDDLLAFELAMAELQFVPQRQIRESLQEAENGGDETMLILHPFIRLLHFRHDPEPLLATVIGERPLPADLPRGNFQVLVDGKDGGMAVRVLDVRLAKILDAFHQGIPHGLDDSEIHSLLKAGLIARWPVGISLPGDAL